MRIGIWDLEADGLLEESENIHCIVMKELDVPGFRLFWDNKSVLHLKNAGNDYHYYLKRDKLISSFMYFDKIVCHNQIGFDIPMLVKFYDINLYDYFEEEDIIDTFIYSQVLHPDRPLPKGCPTTITPPPELKGQGFKAKKIGGHGLDSWGYRSGRKKPEIHDWKRFTPGILHRCKEDVFINEETYKLLIKEAGL